jgi:hypothetical protein
MLCVIFNSPQRVSHLMDARLHITMAEDRITAKLVEYVAAVAATQFDLSRLGR